MSTHSQSAIHINDHDSTFTTPLPSPPSRLQSSLGTTGEKTLSANPSTASLASNASSHASSSSAAAHGNGSHHPHSVSMFALLGVLNSFRMRVQCSTLEIVFGKINIDERSWSLLQRSLLPKNEMSGGIEQLLDTVTEFVKRLHRKSTERVETILDLATYTEDVNFAYRVYSRSHTLQAQIFKFLKPQFSEMENYIEERGHIPPVDLKSIYFQVKPQVDRLYKGESVSDIVASMEATAKAEAEANTAEPAAVNVEESKENGAKKPNPVRSSRANLVEGDGDESEEDYDTNFDDVFDRLRRENDDQQYPLVDKNKILPPIPDMDFLAQYMVHHTRSFSTAETLFDSYTLCLLCQLVALATTEILQKKELHAAIVIDANNLASHFIRLGLPLIEKLCSLEPTFMQKNMLNMEMTGIEKGVHYSDARQLIRKCRLFHNVFAALDIFIFPRIIPAHENGCKCICVSHLDHSFVLTGGYDQALRIWDIAKGKCLAQFIGHTSIVSWCSFSTLDTWLASASFDGTIRIWNARTAETQKVLVGHEDAVIDCDLGSKDKYLVSGSMDCTIRLWATQTGKCLRVYNGHRHWVKTVKFANDGQYIISAGLDKRIFVWNLRGGMTGGPRHALNHANYVLDLLIVNVNRLISTSRDKSIRAWDFRAGKHEQSLENPANVTALSLCLSPDGSLIAAGLFDNSINIYDAKTLELKRQLKVHNDGILCVRWITVRTLIIGTNSGNVQLIHI